MTEEEHIPHYGEYLVIRHRRDAELEGQRST